MTLKFLHVSGLFLDSPFQGLPYLPFEAAPSLRNASIQYLDKLVNLAIFEHVEFVLIAGNITKGVNFGLRGAHFFVEALKRLDSAGIRAVFLPGKEEVESVHGFYFGQLPQLAHKIPMGSTDVFAFETEDSRVVIHPLFDPECRPSLVEGALNIALVSPIYGADLKGLESAFDYVAGPDVRSRRLGFDEPGPHGAVVVEVDDSKSVHVRREDIDVVDFRDVHVSCSDLESLDQLVSVAGTRVPRESGKHVYMRLILEGRTRLANEFEGTAIRDLIQALNSQTEDPVVHWVACRNEIKPPLDAKDLEDPLAQAISRCAELFIEDPGRASKAAYVERAKERLIGLLKEAK
ncbi:hypothetical protein FRD01_22160 [Microvenator marinus]|uniref:Uncharacterized protein n=1 Tax=Microvenator marinus TaxID=2600177 RepID=A0A5B8XY47_9DELT|nr:hypothetical protein [Microvenator marinus]QED29888.1 hypothetical protein FRD01_22160 [Microvenator marinus]